MGNIASEGTSTIDMKVMLKHAITSGDLDTTASIIMHHPEMLKSKLDRVHTSIHMAVLHRSRNLQILERLLSFLQISPGQGKLKDSLHAAALKALNQGCPKDGKSPLMLACDIGDADAIRLLLDAGADYWLRDKLYHRTCMHYAAAKGHAHLIQPLVQCSQGWDASTSPFLRTSLWPLVDVGTTGGFTPLMYASWCNQPETVAALLQHGADSEKRTLDTGYTMKDPHCYNIPEGSSALHVAAQNGSASACAALLINFVRDRDQYIQQLAQDRQAQARGVVPPQMPRRRPTDSRLLLNGRHHTPFVIARNFGHEELLNLLNPFTSLTTALVDVKETIGVPTLKRLAGKASQLVLLQQVDVLAQIIEVARDQDRHRGPWHRLLERGVQQQRPPVLGSLSAPGQLGERPRAASAASTAEARQYEQYKAAGLLPTLFERISEGMEGAPGAGPDIAQGNGLRHRGTMLVLAPLPEALEPCSPPAAEAAPGMPALLGRPSPSAVAVRVGSWTGQRPSLRSVSSWRQASRASGSEATPLPVEYVDWAMDLSGPLSLQPSLKGSCTASMLQGPLLSRGPAAAPGFHVPSGPGPSSPPSLQSSLPAGPRALYRKSSSLKSEQRQLERHARLEAQLSGQQRGLHQLTQGMMQVSASDPALAAMAGSAGSPVPSEQLAGSATRVHNHISSALTLSISPSLDRRLLHAVASLADEVADESLEQTLAAARHHRLLHGVSGHFSRALSCRPSPAWYSAELPEASGFGTLSLGGDGSISMFPAVSATLTVPLGAMALPPSSAIEIPNGYDPSRGMSLPLPSTLFTLSPPDSRGSHTLFSPVVASLLASPAVAPLPAGGPMASVGPLSLVKYSPSAPASVSPGTHVPVGGSMAAVGQLSSALSSALPEEDEYDRMCGVCLDEGDFIAMRPCNHRICVDCARELLKMHSKDPAPCPFCRCLLMGFGEHTWCE